MQKVRAKKQVANALNQQNRSRPMVSVVNNLLLDSIILVWQKSNIGITRNGLNLISCLLLGIRLAKYNSQVA